MARERCQSTIFSRYVNEKRSADYSSTGNPNTSKTMKDNKKGYFEPLNFGVVNYLALDNQNRETFYPSLSEERGYF